MCQLGWVRLHMPPAASSGPYRVRVSSDDHEARDPGAGSDDPGYGSDDQRGDGRSPQRRIPAWWLVPAMVVLVLGIWAATRVGERPSLEEQPSTITTDSGVSANSDGSTGDGGRVPNPDSGAASGESDATFTADAPALPSAGCSTPAGDTAPLAEDLLVEGNSLASYSIRPPSDTDQTDDDPVPLLVVISEPGAPVADLDTTSALADTTPGWVHVSVDPLVGGDELGDKGVPVLIEAVAGTRCIDENRVFVVGFGEGGRAAGVSACAAPGQVVGVAMVAGWAEPGCDPDPPVAVRIIAAEDDPTVELGTALEEIGTAWAEAVGADDLWVDGRDEETLVRHWSGPGGITVETTATVTGGHEWTIAASLAMATFLHDTARQTD